MAPAQPGQWSGPPPPEKIYMNFALEGWHKNPDKVAVFDINSGQEVTFRQLEDRVRSFAGSLQALGVQSRTKVQYYADNCLNSLVAMQAALFCNASVFLFKPYKTTKYAEYKFQTEEAEVELIITDEVNYDIGVCALLEDPDCHVKKVVIVEGIPQKAMPEGKVLFSNQLPKGEFIPPEDVRIHEDILIVSYTSGSTGVPKGVMHSHYSFVAGLHSMALPSLRVIVEVDRFLLLSTLAYISGLMGSSGVLAPGGTLVLAFEEIDADLPIYVENHQITEFVMLECSMRTLMNNAHRFPNRKQMLSTLRQVLVGGTVFPEHLRKQIETFFEGIPLMNAYGMTESLGPVALHPPRPAFTTHVGFITPQFEVKILNDKGQSVEIGERGELLCRGPPMTLGYWKRGKSCDFTDDGFFITGDLVTVDVAGNMTVVGRKKHFIICLDERVAPDEIESVILQHSAVKEVVVVATPHPVVQEAPTAMVILASRYKTLDELDKLRHELIDHVRMRLSDYKHLHGGVFFVDELDKTDSGKYARKAIADRALRLAGISV